MDRHSRNYELLGIRPGDSWQKMRDGYKSAVRKWHPDRFTQGGSERGAAEEKTKEINRAYQELQKHYLQHGTLPLDETQPSPSSAEEIVTPPPDQASASNSTTDQHGWEPPSGIARKRGAGAYLRFGLALIGLSLTGYYFLAEEDGGQSTTNHFAESSNDVSSTQPAQITQEVTARYFTLGSTLGEVLSAQGTPTRTDGETWYYGDAKVFFENGKVTHWVDSTDQRLRAESSHKPQTERAAIEYFDKGSTKAEVRTVQGTPLHETDKVWEYNISRIYFDGDKVIGWTESPMDPLHVKR